MFNTYRPVTLIEALELLEEEKCIVFAGGTDLMIRKRQWQGANRNFKSSVMYISSIKELKGIKEYEDRFEIYALTTQSDIVNSNLPDYIKIPFSLMANPAVRNIATVGGNIVNAASVADSIPVFIGLNAKVELVSLNNKREMLLNEFIIDKYKTDLNKNEIFSKVIIKKENVSEFFYKKIGQRKVGILAKLSVFILKLDGEIRVSIGAINNTTIRDVNLEKKYFLDKNLNEFLESIKEKMFGSDDRRSTKKYKETVVINLIEDYLKGEADEL